MNVEKGGTQMKKFVALLLAAVFCVSATLPGTACVIDSQQMKENPVTTELDMDMSIEDMKQSLQQRDYPADYLDSLIAPQIETLYEIIANDKNARFYSVENKIMSTNENEGSLTRGNIPTSELDYQIALTLSTAYYGNIQYITKVYVTITYNWLKLPFFRLDDAIAVNWDSSVLGYVDNSFKEYNYGKTSNSNTWTTYRTVNAASKLTQGGLGTFASLNLQNATGLRGTVSFQLMPKSGFSMGCVPDGSATTINAQYVHNKSSFTGASFGVTDSSVVTNARRLTDSMSKSSVISYSAMPGI